MAAIFLWHSFNIFQKRLSLVASPPSSPQTFKKINFSNFSNINNLDSQDIRKRTLLQYCMQHKRERSYNSLVHKKRQMWYNDDLGLIYCYVPKVACTNWKRVLQTLRGEFNDPLTVEDKEYVHRLYHPRLLDLNSAQISKRINMYYSFLFVRHPMERIVSAYRNKFEDPYFPYFEKMYGSTILKLFRPGLTDEQYNAGKGVTFEEFIRYIIHMVDNGKIKKLNEHWQTVENLCHPCSMKYSFIGKMDTLIPDAKQVLKEGGWHKTLRFPTEARDKYKENAGFELVKKYMRKLSNETIDRLLSIYMFDMRAFDYEFDEAWRPAR